MDDLRKRLQHDELYQEAMNLLSVNEAKVLNEYLESSLSEIEKLIKAVQVASGSVTDADG